MIGHARSSIESRRASAFDDEGREITPPRSVEYDTLVIAIGSVTNDFGTRGVAQYAVPLETPAQAGRVNPRLVNALIRAQTQERPVRPRPPHVAVVGAGAARPPMAAQLHPTTPETVAHRPHSPAPTPR